MQASLFLLDMADKPTVFIGSGGGDHLSLTPVAEGTNARWFRAQIRIVCDGMSGTTDAYLQPGELAKFAEEVRKLHRNLVGPAKLSPLEPNIVVEMIGDGRGHIRVKGSAQNDFSRKTSLNFEFTIDQTYLSEIAETLEKLDPQR